MTVTSFTVDALAARRLQRELVIAACAAWVVPAVAHLVFHARHVDGFGTVDAVQQITSLALVAALPAIAVWASRPHDPPAMLQGCR